MSEKTQALRNARKALANVEPSLRTVIVEFCNDMADELEKAEEAIQRLEDENQKLKLTMQPRLISSAPRDGAPIIVSDTNGNTYEAYFQKFDDYQLDDYVDDWRIAGMNLEERREQLGFWYTKDGRLADAELGCFGDSRVFPILWTPMPEFNIKPYN
jgi:hypothetical protein